MDLWGLLDTGADYLMLEATVAQSVGIDLRGCPTVEVIIASGASVWLPKTTIDVTILNKRAKVEAIFGIQGTALVGRTTILKVMDFGIDIDGWLHRVV